mgnify:CR=1 FL=1
MGARLATSRGIDHIISLQPFLGETWDAASVPCCCPRLYPGPDMVPALAVPLLAQTCVDMTEIKGQFLLRDSGRCGLKKPKRSVFRYEDHPVKATYVGFLYKLLHRIRQPLPVQPNLAKAVLAHLEPAMCLLSGRLFALLLQDDVLGRYPSWASQKLESMDGGVIA